MRTLVVSSHIYRSGGVFQNVCSSSCAGAFKGFFSIIDDHFLAEGIDKMFCASGNPDFMREKTCECDGIAYDISPQTAICRDYHCIIHSFFNLSYRQCAGIAGVHLICRNKLIIDPVIKHQQHRTVCRVILNCKKTFGCVVCFHVTHSRTRENMPVLLPVRGEADSAVKKNLQVRPYFMEVLFSGGLKDILYEY